MQWPLYYRFSPSPLRLSLSLPLFLSTFSSSACLWPYLPSNLIDFRPTAQNVFSNSSDYGLRQTARTMAFNLLLLCILNQEQRGKRQKKNGMCVSICVRQRERMTESYPWPLRPDKVYLLIPFTSCQGNIDNPNKIWTNDWLLQCLFTLSGRQTNIHKYTQRHKNTELSTHTYVNQHMHTCTNTISVTIQHNHHLKWNICTQVCS